MHSKVGLKSLSLLILVPLLGLVYTSFRFFSSPIESIRIGVLHSLTGTMAVSERPLVDAIRLAVEEINSQGGLLGRPLEMIIADGKSDPEFFATEAERLFRDEKINVLFGCWTSRCRKQVEPIVEKYHNLMFYSLQYEGLEQSPNVIYTGSAPNQQIIPGARWAIDQLGRNVYLIGSNYLFPRVASEMIRDVAHTSEAKIIGARFLPLGTQDFTQVIHEIRTKKPDVILNLLNGDSNAGFFKGLIEAKLSQIPLVSFSVAEEEMKLFFGSQLTNHYGVWSYFQSVRSSGNQQFVAKFKRRFGADRVTSDPIEATYVALHLWARAVKHENSADPRVVNSESLLRQTVPGPSEIAAIHSLTRHTWKMVRVGRVKKDGQFEQVYSSRYPLKPSPWPIYRSREEWEDLLERVEKDLGEIR